MKICPIAIVAGCAACPIVRVCPLKTVVGDWQPPQQPAAPAPAPARQAPPAPRAGAAKKRPRAAAPQAAKRGRRP
jgi:hypothetical protein